MGAAVCFQRDSRPLFDTFCLGKPVGFSIRQKMEQNPTYNWADLIHFRDEGMPLVNYLYASSVETPTFIHACPRLVSHKPGLLGCHALVTAFSCDARAWCMRAPAVRGAHA